MNHAKTPPPLVFWIIWLALLVSVFVYQFFLGGGLPVGEDEGSPPFVFIGLSLGVVLVATAIRWFVIPRQRDPKTILILMIVGLSLAESAEFYQLFLIGDQYPQTQLSLFLLSVLGVAQFAPFYAKRRDEPSGG